MRLLSVRTGDNKARRRPVFDKVHHRSIQQQATRWHPERCETSACFQTIFIGSWLCGKVEFDCKSGASAGATLRRKPASGSRGQSHHPADELALPPASIHG